LIRLTVIAGGESAVHGNVTIDALDAGGIWNGCRRGCALVLHPQPDAQTRRHRANNRDES
jgi:hypothetical protein